MRMGLCRTCDPEEARATFKMLKSSHIADGSAHLYAEWAKLETAAGESSCRAASCHKLGHLTFDCSRALAVSQHRYSSGQ